MAGSETHAARSAGTESILGTLRLELVHSQHNVCKSTTPSETQGTDGNLQQRKQGNCLTKFARA